MVHPRRAVRSRPRLPQRPRQRARLRRAAMRPSSIAPRSQDGITRRSRGIWLLQMQQKVLQMQHPPWPATGSDETKQHRAEVAGRTRAQSRQGARWTGSKVCALNPRPPNRKAGSAPALCPALRHKPEPLPLHRERRAVRQHAVERGRRDPAAAADGDRLESPVAKVAPDRRPAAVQRRHRLADRVQFPRGDLRTGTWSRLGEQGPKSRRCRGSVRRGAGATRAEGCDVAASRLVMRATARRRRSGSHRPPRPP